ncbi:MAG TPA: hypothetical protein VF528_09155 [Pyrinomonadaceae bacterium]|jgi:hypothetical protein
MKIIKSSIVVIIFVLFLNLFSILSFACSLTDGYLRPSNYDLVEEADAILLAEAISFDSTVGANEMPPLPKFTFKILEVIKGDFTQDLLEQGGVDTYLGKSDENDFSALRPGAGTGACNAYDYQVGKKFLLFVNKNKAGGWRISGAPFSRINEEVSNSDSPWVIAVRHYTRISSLNNYEAEKVELRKLQENAKRGDEAKKYPAGLVKDVEEYFKSPYPTKSYQDLIKLYNNFSNKERRQVLWAFAWGKHPEAKPLIQNLLQAGKWEEFIAPISEYAKRTKDRSLIKTLASTYLKIKDKQTRWPIMWALIEAADERDSELMLAALKSADEEEAGRLAVWFVRHPVEEATEIIRKLVDSKYQERWELAFSLAGLGDAGVLEWAQEFIRSSNKDRWMGYYVIAHSPLAEADKLARVIIKENNPKDVLSLIQGYKDSANPNRWERLLDVINIKSKDSEVDYWLRRTLEGMAEDGDNKATELLSIMK